MGCLCTATFLINNPEIKIAGVIVGSPFWGFGANHKISTARRLIISFLANYLEELPINNAGSLHFLTHDMKYYVHESLGSKTTSTSVSGGIVNSMMESVEDIHTNAKLYKKPTLCFIGGKEKIVQNGSIREFLKKCGVPPADLKVRLYANAYHNIHQE
jgi:alpha-beta hydrolase superfamily lysophospholipase